MMIEPKQICKNINDSGSNNNLFVRKGITMTTEKLEVEKCGTEQMYLPGTTKDKRDNHKVVCYGPVQNLESLVPSQWWKTVFSDHWYLKTDGDVVEDPEITTEEIRLLDSYPDVHVRLRQSNTKLLDLCCGQGRHSLELAKQFPHLASIHGHDQSSYLIELARRRLSENRELQHPDRVHFSVGDCRSIPFPDEHFDVILVMGNSFGYFEADEGDSQVLTEIRRVLAPNGVLILDLTNGAYMKENFSARSWEWIDEKTFVCRERALSGDGKRLLSREVITDVLQGVVRDQFYQERLYEEEEVLGQLRTVGLVKSHVMQEEVNTGKEMSKRKQDLGMMEYRMFIMACKSGNDSYLYDYDKDIGKICSSQQQQLKLKRDLTQNPLALGGGALCSSESGLATSLSNNSDSVTSTSTSSTADNSNKKIGGALLLEHTLQTQKLILVLGDPRMPCVGKLNDSWNEEDIETRKKLLKALQTVGYSIESGNLIILDDHRALVKQLMSLDEKVLSSTLVFNLCDEGYDNIATQELHVPSFLEAMGYKYSGAGPACLAICYDKQITNRTAKAIGVPTPQEVFLSGPDILEALSDPSSFESQQIREELCFPLFVKPAQGDNSYGIFTSNIISDWDQLISVVRDLIYKYRVRDICVQEYLSGTEYGIGMIGNPECGDVVFLPILEVDFSRIKERKLPPILGYESKWDPHSPYWNDIRYIRAQGLGEDQERLLQDHALKLFQRFGCRDYARFDFRADSHGTIKLLEVNPNPGWCWDGKLNHMASNMDLEYPGLLKAVISAAEKRLNGGGSAAGGGNNPNGGSNSNSDQSSTSR